MDVYLKIEGIDADEIPFLMSMLSIYKDVKLLDKDGNEWAYE